MEDTMKYLKKSCIKCGSKNVVTKSDRLETDTKCKDCGERYGVADLRIALGFTKKECYEIDKKK